MWEHFSSRYDVVDLQEGQASELAELTSNVQGAFIEQFCRGYLSQRRQAILLAKGYSGMLQALKSGASVSDSEVKNSITYEQFRNDVGDYLKRAEVRNGETEDKDKPEMGFHTIIK
jgi:hypothetical protein